MIYERKLKNRIKWRAQVYSPIEKKIVYSKTCDTRNEAVKEEARLIRAIEKSEILKRNRPSALKLDEAAALWLTSVRSHYAERTWHGHEYYYRHYVSPIFGLFQVNRISAVHILKYKAGIENSPENRAISGHKALAPETVNKILTVLALIFKFCRDVLKVISVSPMDGIQRATVPQVKHVTWSVDQISAFLAATKASPFWPMLALAFATGMRPGEICGLAETDLQPGRILTINRGVNNLGHITELKTARSHRALVLSPELDDMIRDVLKSKQRKRTSLKIKNDFLFVGALGAPIYPNELSAAFARILKEYNAKAEDPLPVMSLYGARHSFATNMLIAGEKSLLVSEIMGNSTSTMEHHYAHLKETMHAAALAGYSSRIWNSKSE